MWCYGPYAGVYALVVDYSVYKIAAIYGLVILQ